MKLSIIPLLLLVQMTFNVNAQTFKITYKRKANLEYQLRNVEDSETRERITKHLVKDSTTYNLLHAKNKSIYYRINYQKANSISLIVVSVDSIYKDFDAEKVIFKSKLEDINYVVQDDWSSYKYILTGNEKEILGYKCQEIEIYDNNKKYTAWFTPELGVNDGPANFWIDKGLILEIDLKKHIIKAENIQEISNKSSISEPKDGKPISVDNYNKKVALIKSSVQKTKFD